MNNIGIQIILKYFPGLSREQIYCFEKLAAIYRNWNTLIRILPRKDLDTLYEDHVLHSLAIAKIINFKPGSRILDVGTGGGFPGIPLAILFPSCQFTLLDSMQRRILVVKGVIETLKLKNANAMHGKVEDIFDKYDFVVSRAVAAFPILVGMVKKNVCPASRNLRPNGLIYLKGGSFDDEIVDYMTNIEVSEIIRFFDEPCFRTKKVIYLPILNNYPEKIQLS